MGVAFRYAARSNIGLGSKGRNEDSAYAGPELLVLCDGMGGHAAGDVASSLVVGEMVHLDGESHGADDALDILSMALEGANSRLADVMEVYPDSDGMGTTCIAMIRTGSKLAVANIGDSRAYLLRAGRLTQITKDHSFVQDLLDEGRISREEALHHPQRSLVTRVLTGRLEDGPDLSLRELSLGDRIMICSDGLTDYVAEETVAGILKGEGTPGQIADALIEIALRASTRDNVTVIVADVVNPGDGTTRPQVVGAASERRTNRPLGHLSPAEKAAALAREASGQLDTEPPVLAEEEPRSPLRRWVRRVIIATAVIAVLAAGVWGTWSWSQQQYFVGEQDGMVTIYRGLAQDLGPISLSTAEEQTDLPVDSLPTFYQQQVHGTLSARDREGADTIVAELRALAVQGCQPRILLPDGSEVTQIPPGAVIARDGEVATAAPTGALPGDALHTAAPTGALPEASEQTARPDGIPPVVPFSQLLELGQQLGSLGQANGSALGSGEADGQTASPTGGTDEARPTVTLVYPEGCP